MTTLSGAFVVAAAGVAQAATPTWTQKSPPTKPPAYSEPELAFDAARGHALFITGDFSGNNGCSPASSTWTWNGTTWANASPATSPRSREDGSIVYDAARGETVLFGGWYGPCGAHLNDTWVWNGSTWTQKNPTVSPPARRYASAAYDAARGEVVVFGGYSGSTLLNDTWVWNGSTWAQRTPATRPSPRSDAVMAYDAARGEVVLFGGFDSNTGVILGDTWVWNGSAWTQRTPTTSPLARANASMAYYAPGNEVILYGGAATGTPFGDTWAWNGSTWATKTVATSPGARHSAGLAYDSARQELVLFGGWGGVTRDDTWVYRNVPQCSDGLDNDADGATDFPTDAGCTSGTDDTESPNPTAQCGDGTDNDGDGRTDYPADPGCTSTTDNSESPDPPTPQCGDGTDNDGDGKTDYPADPGCTSTTDNSESPDPAPFLDVDGDFVPDEQEPVLCANENPNFDFDGTCIGSDYSPPTVAGILDDLQ